MFVVVRVSPWYYIFDELLEARYLYNQGTIHEPFSRSVLSQEQSLELRKIVLVNTVHI